MVTKGVNHIGGQVGWSRLEHCLQLQQSILLAGGQTGVTKHPLKEGAMDTSLGQHQVVAAEFASYLCRSVGNRTIRTKREVEI